MREEFLGSVNPSGSVNEEVIRSLEHEAIKMVEAVQEVNP